MISGLDAATLALVLLLFAEIVAYGADRMEVALSAALLQLGLLLGLLVFNPGFRAALQGQPGIRFLYGGFAGVFACGLLQFAPWPQGMARAAWQAAQATPAITIDRFATLAELIKLAGLGAVFIIGSAIGRNPRRAERCATLMMILATGYIGGALVYFAAYATPGAEGRLRLAGALLNPNNAAALAAVFGVVATVQAAAAIRRLQGRRSTAAGALGPLILPALLIVLTALAIAMTASRGGALSAVVGVGAAAILGWQVRPDGRSAGSSWAALAGMTGIFVIGMALIFAGGIMPERMLSLADGVEDRIANIRLYGSRLEHVPWTGFGLGTFTRFNSIIAGSSDATKLWQFGAMHNVVLQWIYEAGWAGAGFMFMVIAAALAQIARGFFRWPAPAAASALAASAVLLSHGMIDFDLQVPAIAALWALLLGLGFGAANPLGRQSSAVFTTMR